MKMPFNCFKYNFYASSKRYHTAAKNNATAFFDSSFNYIRQNSHLLSLESISSGSKKYPNPHPANSTTTNYLTFDYNSNNNILVNDDENNSSATISDSNHSHLNNPMTLILPYQIDQVSLAINHAGYQQVLKKIPPVNVSAVLHSSSKLSDIRHPIKKYQQPAGRYLHTVAIQSNIQSDRKSSPTLVEEKEDKPKYFQPSLDILPDPELSDATFLDQQTKVISEAYSSKQFEKIHSVYMAIKRNNLVPSRDVYSLVLKSIVQRTIDDSTDEKLSTMLNVYQDLLQHKIKPDLEIYSTVISQLLDSSITSSIDSKISTNGSDFFKIAIDIFNASNSSQIQNFDNKIIDSILIGMNLYPGFVNSEQLQQFLTNHSHINKSHIYYIGLINHCKLTNDSAQAIKLYEDFKQQSIKSPELTEKQFLVYSAFISTLVHTEEITLATKFLDKLLTTIKNYNNFEPKINMLLTSYLLSLSKKNVSKALEIWAQFNSIDWIPEFSYAFYTHLLNDVTEYSDAQKIYNYMVVLPRSLPKKVDLETLLLTPQPIDSISRYVISAVQFNDKTAVLKTIKESLVRKSTFDFTVYPIIFQYLQNNELTTRVVNAHGLAMSEGFDFVSYLTSFDNIESYMYFKEIASSLFFQKLVADYKMFENKNYEGFYKILNSIFNGKPDSSMIPICSSLIVEFHDLDNFYSEIQNRETFEFKQNLTRYFKQLISDFSLNEQQTLPEMTSDAIKLVNDISELNN